MLSTNIRSTNKNNCFRRFILIVSLSNAMMEYSYPARKSSRDSFTIYKERKIDLNLNVFETHKDYMECITSCYNKKEKCSSIEVEIKNNITFTCRFFKDEIPKTKQAEGFLFISAKPPKCSLSCSLALNPCGKCDCNPSCAARNWRQHLCNCSKAAGVKNSCQEHYNNGFKKTGVFQIRPNGSAFETICEMDKVEHQNPKVTNPICYSLKPKSQLSFNNSVSYCVVTCAKNTKVNTMFFSNTSGCFCGNRPGSPSQEKTQSDYCKIDSSSKSCNLLKVDSGKYVYYDKQDYIGYISWRECVIFCADYQQKNPTQNGYVASFIADVYGDCQCLYGFSGQSVYYNLSCSFFETIPPTALPNIKVNERVLTKNSLLATLTTLEKTYSVSFKLNLRSYISSINSYRNVIHFTNGDDLAKYGYRTPAIWIWNYDSNKWYIHICSAVNGEKNYIINTISPPLNVWSSIQISQINQNGIYRYKIYLNEKVIHSITNTNPQSFSNVEVYAANPWDATQDGSIKDLKIITESDSTFEKCAAGWIFNENYCYLFNSVTFKNWEDSRLFCLQYGDLLSVADEAESLFIKEQLASLAGVTIRDIHFWIGLSDQINENVFVWSDDTPVLIQNWSLEEPNDMGGNEDCVEIGSSGTWNDNNCNSQFGFICKAKTGPVEQELSKGILNATLPLLEKTYSIYFKIKPRSYSKGMKSVIHLTVGQDNDQYGDRCPAVWFHDDVLGSLYISSAVNGINNYSFNTEPLMLNQWSSVQISQYQKNGIYMYTIYLNEILVHSVINTKPQSFSNVKVYTSDPWYDAQDGYIKDLKIICGNIGVWIPMMTRFADWETSFWNRSYEAYENGFGLVNQQWIGLKKIYQITNTFFTDMRVDYVFEESITYSTMYYNVTIGSSNDNYLFSYEKYDPRGSNEPDRFNANGATFKSCSNWWTANCDTSTSPIKSPTSLYNISYGSNENLVAIYFYLRTNEIRGPKN